MLTSGDLICTFDRPELLLPAARCTPLWRDVLLGKSPLPGMKAISTMLSSLETQHIQRHVQSDVHTYNMKKTVVLCVVYLSKHSNSDFTHLTHCYLTRKVYLIQDPPT